MALAGISEHLSAVTAVAAELAALRLGNQSGEGPNNHPRGIPHPAHIHFPNPSPSTDARSIVHALRDAVSSSDDEHAASAVATLLRPWRRPTPPTGGPSPSPPRPDCYASFYTLLLQSEESTDDLRTYLALLLLDRVRYDYLPSPTRGGGGGILAAETARWLQATDRSYFALDDVGVGIIGVEKLLPVLLLGACAAVTTAATVAAGPAHAATTLFSSEIGRGRGPSECVLAALGTLLSSALDGLPSNRRNNVAAADTTTAPTTPSLSDSERGACLRSGSLTLSAWRVWMASLRLTLEELAALADVLEEVLDGTDGEEEGEGRASPLPSLSRALLGVASWEEAAAASALGSVAAIVTTGSASALKPMAAGLLYSSVLRDGSGALIAAAAAAAAAPSRSAGVIDSYTEIADAAVAALSLNQFAMPPDSGMAAAVVGLASSAAPAGVAAAVEGWGAGLDSTLPALLAAAVTSPAAGTLLARLPRPLVDFVVGCCSRGGTGVNVASQQPQPHVAVPRKPETRLPRLPQTTTVSTTVSTSISRPASTAREGGGVAVPVAAPDLVAPHQLPSTLPHRLVSASSTDSDDFLLSPVVTTTTVGTSGGGGGSNGVRVFRNVLHGLGAGGGGGGDGGDSVTRHYSPPPRRADVAFVGPAITPLPASQSLLPTVSVSLFGSSFGDTPSPAPQQQLQLLPLPHRGSSLLSSDVAAAAEAADALPRVSYSITSNGQVATPRVTAACFAAHPPFLPRIPPSLLPLRLLQPLCPPMQLGLL